MSDTYRYADMGVQEIERAFRDDIESALRTHYGPAPGPAIEGRVREEWAAMEAAGDIVDVAALYELTLWLKERREPYWMRGTSGASLILHLLGVTAGNPLPPHYYCPQCHRVAWANDCIDGFDLPADRACESDGARLCGDGHNIPWQTHWGYGREPIYDIDVPEHLLEPLNEFFQGHWLAELRPGTEFARRHTGPDANPCFMEFSRLSINCILDSGEISTDFYHIVQDASCIQNAVKVLDANLDAMDDMDARLRSYPVSTFADIIAKYGLAHSTNAWDKDARYMVDRLGYSLADMIAYRDDVFSYLITHGFLEKDAWKGMERVRKGHGLPMITSEMSQARDKWVIERCKKIVYLFPKAHALEYIFFHLRAAGLRSKFVTSYEALFSAMQIDRVPGVILLGARPGMGKSTFVKYFSERLSTVSGKKAVIFSQEETEQRISIDLIRDHINAVRPDFVIIDFLQAIVDFSFLTGKGGDEMVSFMAGIRALADNMKVPILVVSGLDRKTDRQKKHMPRIENIPRSADILPYVDVAMFLHRPAYYDMEASRDQASCMIVKFAGGTTAEVPLLWDDKKAVFGDVLYSLAGTTEWNLS